MRHYAPAVLSLALVLGACTSPTGVAAARPDVQSLLQDAESARQASEARVLALISGSDTQALIQAAGAGPMAPIPTSAPSGQTVTWRQAVDNGNGTVTVSSGSIGREFPTYRDLSIVVTVDKSQPERVLQFKASSSVSEDVPAGETVIQERTGTVDGPYRETLHLERRQTAGDRPGTSVTVDLLATSPNGRGAERRAYLLTLANGDQIGLTTP